MIRKSNLPKILLRAEANHRGEWTAACACKSVVRDRPARTAAGISPGELLELLCSPCPSRTLMGHRAELAVVETGIPATAREWSLPWEELPLPCTGAHVSANQAADHDCETKEKPYNKNVLVQLQLSWQLPPRL